MPPFHNTPESLLGRSDSKNPATTCKGITASGRPCRRALASSPRSSPAPSPQQGSGVLAVVSSETAAGVAAFFCWQHKDQAQALIRDSSQRTSLLPLKERSSIETLVDRLRVLGIDESRGAPKKTHRTQGRQKAAHSVTRDALPTMWQNVEAPLLQLPSRHDQPLAQNFHPFSGRSTSKASFLCCIQPDVEYQPPPRRHVHSERPSKRPPMSQTSPVAEQTRLISTAQQYSTHVGPRGTGVARSVLDSKQSSSTSQTKALLSLIPASLGPQTTSLLLSELAKPISEADEEGYIYMFWLTPESEPSRPDDDIASTLLDPVAEASPYDRRGRSELQRYASTSRKATQKQTVLLKIGRAANVHRRLSQWTKQCSYNITLIRYYPYHASQSSNSRPAPPRKVPHVHRVERLIHLELGEKRVIDAGACQNCGKEHREWFEIEATRAGLRVVDEVIRRWVGWADRQSP